jgi:hypothetical protein
MKALRFLETSGNDYPMTERRIPKELDPQPHRCENSELARSFIFIKRVMFLILRAGIAQSV